MTNDNESNGGNGNNRRDGDSGYTKSGSSPGKQKESKDSDFSGNPRLGKRIVDIHGLSSYLGVCINTIYSWVSQEAIPSIKLGRLLRFDLDKIDIWIAERERNPKSAA